MSRARDPQTRRPAENATGRTHVAAGWIHDRVLRRRDAIEWVRWRLDCVFIDNAPNDELLDE